MAIVIWPRFTRHWQQGHASFFSSPSDPMLVMSGTGWRMIWEQVQRTCSTVTREGGGRGGRGRGMVEMVEVGEGGDEMVEVGEKGNEMMEVIINGLKG